MDDKKYPKLIRHSYYQMAEEWDDLAEDCSIASNQEIKALFSKIASKLQ